MLSDGRAIVVGENGIAPTIDPADCGSVPIRTAAPHYPEDYETARSEIPRHKTLWDGPVI